MPTFIPRFKLYDTDGTTLKYTFLAVQSTNAPQSINRNSVVEGIRGKGCIVIPGSEASWDLYITGILLDNNYENLTGKIDALEAAVVLHTPYILKIDKTLSTSYSYHVKRISAIEYPDNLRTNNQEYKIVFKTSAW